MVTVNLSADFADVARAGDWVEARVDVQKMGRRLAFASCHLWVGEKRILRASGIFAHVPPAGREGPFEG
jgi:acyl-coenzyme A thioesterase PaaI-like protein